MKKYICLTINGEVIKDFDTILELNQFIINEYIDNSYYICHNGKLTYNENGYWLVK